MDLIWKRITPTTKQIAKIYEAAYKPPPPPPRFLVASIGNPEQDNSTTSTTTSSSPPPHPSSSITLATPPRRHSVAHHLLQAFARKYQFPPLSKTPPHSLTTSGSTIQMPEYTLWQSTQAAHVCGRALLKAWQGFRQRQGGRRGWTALVVLHDDPDLRPGAMKLTRGILKGTCAHRGVASVRNAFKQHGELQQLGQRRLLRVAVGVGRPSEPGSGGLDDYLAEQLTEEQSEDVALLAGKLCEWLDTEMDDLPSSKGGPRVAWRTDRTVGPKSGRGEPEYVRKVASQQPIRRFGHPEGPFR